jgi:multidrug resistance efflux pump
VPDVGDPVQPGQVLVELLDQDQPYLLARVPSRLLSRFAAGTEVTVVFSGEGVRRGEVRNIPLQAVPGSAVHLSDAYVDVQIVPKGRLWPRLPIGSRANIDAETAGHAG